MEGIKKELSPAETWASPAIFPCHSGSQGKMVMSTPNLSAWAPLEDSDRSRQDSGYSSFTLSSFTPSSAGSFGQVFEKPCLRCNKLSTNNYEQSTPENICDCENKSFFDGQSPSRTRCVQRISESSSSKIRSRFGPSRALDLNDTSLYTEDMDIELELGDHQCVEELMEIGDEKSIDFLDSSIFSSSSKPDTSRFKKSGEKIDGEVKSSEADIRNLFSPDQDVINFKAVSPKALNETTPTKLKRNSSFQTAGRKVTLMKRVLRTINGLEKVDILYQLVHNQVKFPHVVSKIFSYLPEKDLDSVKRVSTTWQLILEEDKAAYNRWASYNTAMILKKENLMSPTKTGTSGRQRSLPFSPLHNINNQHSSLPPATSPRISPPASPSSVRFRSFQREAKLLKKGERLLSCPKCHFPSHDRGNPTVQCSRSGCRHRFCVWCRNEIVSGCNHNCPPLYTPPMLNTPVARRSAYKLPLVGSKSCKRNLRRL